MKKLVLLTILTGTAAVCAAQETARVISSTPVMSQVAVPRQVCSTSQVQVQGQKSGVGGIMGAVAGGAIGNSVGGGDGRAVATLIGIIGGAMLGDRIEGGGQAHSQNVQNCTTQTFYENRTTAYNVVYEFNGRQYSVQMPQDPGPTLRLQITPVGATGAVTAPAGAAYVYPPNAVYSQGDEAQVAQVVVEPQVFSQPVAPQTVIIAAPPVVYSTQYVRPYVSPYVSPYGSPYYPPVGVNLNLGWSNGGNGHWHRSHGQRYWR